MEEPTAGTAAPGEETVVLAPVRLPLEVETTAVAVVEAPGAAPVAAGGLLKAERTAASVDVELPLVVDTLEDPSVAVLELIVEGLLRLVVASAVDLAAALVAADDVDAVLASAVLVVGAAVDVVARAGTANCGRGPGRTSCGTDTTAVPPASPPGKRCSLVKLMVEEVCARPWGLGPSSAAAMAAACSARSFSASCMSGSSQCCTFFG